MALGQGIGHEADRQEPGLVEVDETEVAGIGDDEVPGEQVAIVKTQVPLEVYRRGSIVSDGGHLGDIRVSGRLPGDPY